MFDATVEELAAVDGVDPVRANDIREGLARLRELNLLERYG
jgi:DNA integrity scanning protein DisA with diadenylate cyclase activity